MTEPHAVDMLAAARIRIRALLPNTDRADTLDLQAQLAYSLGVLDSIKAIHALERDLAKEVAANA